MTTMTTTIGLIVTTALTPPVSALHVNEWTAS